ncbi:hypothetical protein KS4_34800 [Poriferisphaera corsica]|uniref:PEP-CTERM protein-sorting domain-containing protein n=1 Tax=Poriferisphaera corsica TaxID=2528020 RepID=A0A517YYX9_9BACT|nr:hypothetical protein [Poriferisphaera corsica]QDU35399.1 hypothetical protein KS4_34800 [Poriferisphaera corsica]
MRRLNFYQLVVTSTLIVSVAGVSQASLVTADGVAVESGSEFFTAQNLINTNGLNLGEDNTLTVNDFYTESFNEDHSWVTNNNGASDYYSAFAEPVLTFTFDEAQDINQIAVWGYAVENTLANGIGNSARTGTVEFSTDGINYGDAIAFNVDLTFQGDGATVTEFDTQNGVVAARITFTDNYANLNGGDRVGANLVAFNTVDDPAIAVPTPTAASLALAGLAAMFCVRKRRVYAPMRVRS